jgi:hypothetical protein
MNTYDQQLAEHAVVLLSLSAAGTYLISTSERRKSPSEWMKRYLKQSSMHGALQSWNRVTIFDPRPDPEASDPVTRIDPLPNRSLL